MTDKKTKSKVGGTRIRRARKPSIIAIIVLALISLSIATWFIVRSFAYTEGWITLNMTTPNGAAVPGASITVMAADSNYNDMTTTCNGVNYPPGSPVITTGSNGSGRQMCMVSSATATSKLYKIKAINVPSGYVLDGNSLYASTPIDWAHNAFVHTPGGTTFNFKAIPSGCGAGTQNNQCASISSFSVNPTAIPYLGTATFNWDSSWTSGCTLSLPGKGLSVGSKGPYTKSNIESGGTVTLTCTPSAGGATIAAQLSLSVQGPPSIEYFTGQTSIPYNATTTLSWNSLNTASCRLNNDKGSFIANVSTKGSWTSPKLTASTGYILACSNSIGIGASSKYIGISVAGVPPPPPPLPDGCGPGTKNNTCKPGTGGGGTTTTSKPPTTVANNAPTTGSQKPSAPGNLKAEENSGAVVLTWDASTDDKGIASYIIERSTDNKEWSTLSESSDTTYTDTDANFNTLYYYRVSAKDTDGNVSDYAVAEITTGAFEANAFKDSDSTITSEDGVVVAKIPAGALSEDAACEIVIDEESQGALGKKKVLHGPYKLVCKKKDGSTFDKFDKPITYELTISDEAKKQNPALYGFADNQWTKSSVAYSKDAPNFAFESDVPAPFAVLSESSFPWLWVILLMVLISLLLGAFLWWRRRNSDDGSYVGSDYNPSTMYGDASASAQPAANPGAMTIPSTPVSDDSEAPGQHQIHVKATPVHNPALEHHSPLDRLNEMEEADTKQDIPGGLTAPGDTSTGGVQPKDPGK